MSKEIMSLIAGGLFLLIIALGVNFATLTFGAVDAGSNMTGSEYEDQYNSSIDVGKGALSFLSITPYLVAVAVVIGAVIIMAKFGGII